jgi:hypothetical protein
MSFYVESTSFEMNREVSLEKTTFSAAQAKADDLIGYTEVNPECPGCSYYIGQFEQHQRIVRDELSTVWNAVITQAGIITKLQASNNDLRKELSAVARTQNLLAIRQLLVQYRDLTNAERKARFTSKVVKYFAKKCILHGKETDLLAFYIEEGNVAAHEASPGMIASALRELDRQNLEAESRAEKQNNLVEFCATLFKSFYKAEYKTYTDPFIPQPEFTADEEGDDDDENSVNDEV